MVVVMQISVAQGAVLRTAAGQAAVPGLAVVAGPHGMFSDRWQIAVRRFCRQVVLYCFCLQSVGMRVLKNCSCLLPAVMPAVGNCSCLWLVLLSGFRRQVSRTETDRNAPTKRRVPAVSLQETESPSSSVRRSCRPDGSAPGY